MKLIFDIPDAQLTRISKALNREGFVFVAGQGTQVEQRRKFFRELTIQYWKSLVFNDERADAIALEPNDSAALQAARFIGLDNIVVTEE